MGVYVILYVPNIIGYFRIILVLLAWVLHSQPKSFLALYVTSVILDEIQPQTFKEPPPASLLPAVTHGHTYFDPEHVLLFFCTSHPIFLSLLESLGVDGWLARRLHQTSRFGAWLDVVVDNLGRGMLWNMLYDWGWLVSSLEWCVFVCNHNLRGANWKNSFNETPVWVRAVMAKGFKTPLGILSIAGLHVLPVWLFGIQREIFSQVLCVPYWLEMVGVVVLTAGRLLAFAVEMWCIQSHVRYLLMDEEDEKNN